MPNFTDWTYVINGNSTVSITGINSQPASGDTMVVPTNYSGDPVISLGNSSQTITLANSNVSLSFDSPSNVTTINDFAFNNCSNLSGPLVIPNSVTSIGIEAFRQTNISSLTIGSNIQSIVESTFKDCANLSGPLVIPNNVQDIFSSAFENTNISSLTLGSNVNQIIYNAFKGTPLTGPLSLPNSLNFLGVQAFPPAVDLSLEFSGLSRQLIIIPNQDLAPNLTLSLTNPQPGLAFDSNTNVLTVSAAYGNLTADISQNPNLIITFTPLTIPCLVSPCKVMCVNSVEKDVSELCENDFVISSITKKPSKVIEVRKRVVNNFSKLDPENKPYRIPKDYFCHGLPSTDTMISGNHQLIFASNNKDSFYGIHTNRVMTTSYRVDNVEEIKKFTGSDQLTYYHVLLESGKDAFYANMMPVESYNLFSEE